MVRLAQMPRLTATRRYRANARWTTLAAAGDDGSVRLLFARSAVRNRKVERNDARLADQRPQQPMGKIVDIDSELPVGNSVPQFPAR